jgi:hypothetical protein
VRAKEREKREKEREAAVAVIVNLDKWSANSTSLKRATIMESTNYFASSIGLSYEK